MKLSCTKENLYQGLAITSHITNKNVNLPILENVLLKAENGTLKLISTNLEIGVTCAIRCKIEQQGEYTVPSKLFFDYVNLLPDAHVNIDLFDDALSVNCERSKTKIKGISASEFPLVPPVQGGATYKVPVDNLKAALSQVLFATAKNESRPELSGVFFKFDVQDGNHTLTLASTDSYRLSETIVAFSEGTGERRVIIPHRTLSELSRVFSVFKDDVEAPDAVEMDISDNQIAFRFGSVEITSKVLEGTYPDYQQIIPKETKTDLILDKHEFQKAIKTVSLFSKNGLFDIHLKVNSQEQMVELSASDATRGENIATIPASITGGDNSITMNYRYLLEGVNAVKEDKLHCKLIDGASPCVLSPEGEGKFTYVVMPIRQ